MSTAAKKFRFRFTLRTILVAFAIVSLALVIYRWAWEEEAAYSELLDKTVTTFRRDWSGRKLRHGPEKHYKIENGIAQLRMIRTYVDHEHRSTAIMNDRGIEVAKAHHRNGVDHGPFYDEYRHFHLSGQFENGSRIGDWKYRYQYNGEAISVLQHFENDVPDGKWSWKSATGRALQLATFQQGKLVEWNGMPASLAIERWCDANNLETPIRQSLGEPIDKRWRELKEVERRMGLGFAKTFGWNRGGSSEQILLHLSIGEPGYEFAVDPSYKLHEGAGRSLIDVLVEESMKESRIPAYRYGVLWIVPIADSELNWRDRSNVDRVKFAPGSSPAAAWVEDVLEDISKESRDFEWRFQSLFAGTPIQIDASEFCVPPNSPYPMDQESWRSLTFSPMAPVTNPRSRRDILGFLLSSNGWSCEQRGNLLILHPYPAED